MNADINVIDRLKQHILVDGYHIVVDPLNSCGSWIEDLNTKRRYLDCYSQFASQALGWNHPNLVKHKDFLGEVALHKLANSDMYSEVYADFVDAIAEITPDHKYHFFIDGGSLAVENALKAAFDWKYQITKNKELLGQDGNKMDIIHFYQAFHGRSGYSLSLTNTGDIKTKYFPKFPWTRVLNPKITSNKLLYGETQEDETIALKEVKATLQKGNVAAIIIEPIQGEGGDNHFRQTFLEQLRVLANEYEALLIFDEVQTGIGMTGKMWAYQHFGIVPDLLVFGKKAQVCGFCSTGRIDEVKDNVFKVPSRINSTWGGNTVDMARAKIIFDTIKSESLVENANKMGQQIINDLKYHFQHIDPNHSWNLRGKGLFIAFDLPNTAFRDRLLKRLSTSMIALKSGSTSIRLRPHLTINQEDASLVSECINVTLRELSLLAISGYENELVR